MQLCSESRGEADRSRADDGDGVARPDAAVEHAHLVAGGQDVGEHEDFLIGDAGGHRIGRVVRERHPDVLRLRAIDAVSEDPATAAAALAIAAVPAVAAPTAGADARDQYPVAGSDVLHAGTDLHHSTDRLVAEDPTIRDCR